MAKNKAPILPKTFQQRGVYLPLTTPVLMYARLRRMTGSSMEILIPGLGGGSETYVIPYKVLPQVINTSVHDRALHEEMVNLREVSPAAVRKIASKIAVTGLGGPFLARRAKEDIRAEAELPNEILLCMIQMGIKQLAPNHPGVDKLDSTTIATADGMSLARDALGGYASSIGERGDKIYGRLEKWSSLLTPLGSPDEAVKGPGLSVLHATEALAEQLSKWLIQEPPDTAEMAQRTVTAAREAVKQARETLARITALADNMAEPLRDFDNTIAKLKAGVDHILLVIDGWDRIVQLWDEGNRGDRFLQRDTLEMFSQFLPILPIEAAGDNQQLWEDLRETQNRWTKTAQQRIDGDLDQGTREKLSQFRKEPVWSNPAEQLKAFLTQLPDKELKLLAAKIELDRGENKFGIPHDAIMALLRPRLAEIRAPRIYTPQRLLCLPFEDMLIFQDPDPKETGKIARASIGPMWSLLLELLGDQWDPVAETFITAQKKSDEPGKKAAASQLWHMAAKALKDWDASLGTDAGEIRAAAKKIGGTKRLEDIREMASVLMIADLVEAMKEQLPRKPIIQLTPEHVTIVKRLYDKVPATAPDHEVYILLALIGRLLQPFPILRVFRALSRKMDDTLTSNSDLAIAGDIVIGALEKDASAVAEAADAPNATETDVVAKAKRFANAFKGITSDIGIRRDGEWGKRMYGCRGQVSDAVENLVLATAHDVILDVLPGKGNGTPNFNDFPDDEKFETAERRARALGEASRIAEQIGLQSACQSKVNQMRKELEKYGAKIIEKLPKVEAANQAEASAHLATTVRLVELITNADTADLLRRRGNAALTGTMVK